MMADPIPPAPLVRGLWRREDGLRFLPEIQNVYADCGPQGQVRLMEAVANAALCPTIAQAACALVPLGCGFVECDRLARTLWDRVLRACGMWRERAETAAVRSASPGT